ncbi:MAG: Rrf2 family transcriptional regulator [Candidatus Aminicenantes bacterium]|nr:Rrf2 family transcriptional regulator [Candidatus Aminicenantes bacterium]
MAMKMPAKIRYGIRILVEIGRHPEGALPLAEVEKRQLISAKFAKQILQPLMRARLVGSTRGIKGGYRLLKKPERIRLIDIVNVLSEKDDRIAPCLVRKGICRRDKNCGAKLKWMELQKIVDAFLAKTTLRDMIDAETAACRKVRP